LFFLEIPRVSIFFLDGYRMGISLGVSFKGEAFPDEQNILFASEAM